MQSTPNLNQFVPEQVARFAYQGFQESKKAFGFIHKQVSDRLTNTVFPEQASKSQPISPEIFEKLQIKLKELEEKDWQDAQQGVYSSSLLFDILGLIFSVTIQKYGWICSRFGSDWAKKNFKALMRRSTRQAIPIIIYKIFTTKQMAI